MFLCLFLLVMANSFAMRFYIPLVFDHLHGGRETSIVICISPLSLVLKTENNEAVLPLRSVLYDSNLKECAICLCSILLPAGNIFSQALREAISLESMHTLCSQSTSL